MELKRISSMGYFWSWTLIKVWPPTNSVNLRTSVLSRDAQKRDLPSDGHEWHIFYIFLQRGGKSTYIYIYTHDRYTYMIGIYIYIWWNHGTDDCAKAPLSFPQAQHVSLDPFRSGSRALRWSHTAEEWCMSISTYTWHWLWWWRDITCS